jgi:hypothetical protein
MESPPLIWTAGLRRPTETPSTSGTLLVGTATSRPTGGLRWTFFFALGLARTGFLAAGASGDRTGARKTGAGVGACAGRDCWRGAWTGAGFGFGFGCTGGAGSGAGSGGGPGTVVGGSSWEGAALAPGTIAAVRPAPARSSAEMAQMIARRAPASTTPKTYPFPIEDPERGDCRAYSDDLLGAPRLSSCLKEASV